MQKRRIIITITSLPKVIWEEGRVAALSHVRRKVPIGYNGAAQIRPQKYPFPWTDPQTPPPASSLHPSDQWCTGQTDRRTHVRTYVRTDRQIVHGKVWWLYRPLLSESDRPNNKKKKNKSNNNILLHGRLLSAPPSICAFVRQSNPSGT